VTRSFRRMRELQKYSRWLHERGDNYLDARRGPANVDSVNIAEPEFDHSTDGRQIRPPKEVFDAEAAGDVQQLLQHPQ
jgi:hypothetical protein